MSPRLFLAGIAVIVLAGIFFAVGRVSAPVVSDASAPGNFTDDQRAAIAQIAEEHMLANPELLNQMIELLQLRQQAQRQKELEGGASQYWELLVNDRASPSLGNPDGEIVVVEFYDYRCPYCKQAYRDVHAILEAHDNIRYVFWQYPVLDRPGQDKISYQASLYALAADRLGLFEEYHDLIMTHRGQLSFDRLDALVDADDRFDLAAIKKIAAEADASAFLDSRLDLGGAIGISATPTYVINGKVVEGARGLETLQRTIANAEAEME